MGFNNNTIDASEDKAANFPGSRRIMNSSTKCKHRPVHEIENKLYLDYDDGLYQRMYIELKEEVWNALDQH